MARGWESKSVEDQVAAAEAAKEARAKHPVTEAQRLRESVRQLGESKRQSLRLSRTLIAHRLENATNPRYRIQLESALQDLDKQLRDLDAGSG